MNTNIHLKPEKKSGGGGGEGTHTKTRQAQKTILNNPTEMAIRIRPYDKG